MESNALPLAPPGLGHANSRTISTKEQPFLFLFLQCTVYISSLGPRLLEPLLEERGLIGLQGGRAVTVQEFAMLAVRPEGELRVFWGTSGILVDKVRSPLSGDELVG